MLRLSVIFDPAEKRLHTALAIVAELIEGWTAAPAARGRRWMRPQS